jgi:uncharacterized iron-regulated membrane protein
METLIERAPEQVDEPEIPAQTPAATATSGAGSTRWRSLWRLHFYAGIFSMPFILLMAVTGLVILYSQPIHDLTQGDIREVAPGASVVSYDVQEHNVELAFPSAKVTAMQMPADNHHSTIFSLDDGSSVGLEAMVNPYTGTVLGTNKPGSGIVGLSNRLHGFSNNKDVKVSLPTVSALWDHGAIMRPYVVGDLALELMGGWTLVLALSGLYLWWPRKSPTGRNTRRFLRIRRGTRGRARWRDLHGMSGVLLLGALLLTIVSGMAWSTYWGSNFTSLANKVSPNTFTDAPASVLGTKGSVTRLGNQMPWNTGDRPIPASYAPTSIDGTLPAPLRLDDVVKIASLEGMKPGYMVAFPSNAKDDTTGNMVYGSFTVTNSWPRKTGEARDLFLDQFSGATLGQTKGFGYGAVSYAMDTLVSTHMGTQLGLIDRIFMTALCVLAIWSVVSAAVMYSKRRRKGSMGLPRRPVDVKLARGVGIIAITMAIVYPVWGASAALVLAFDRFVVRRTRLRRAFGQR